MKTNHINKLFSVARIIDPDATANGTWFRNTAVILGRSCSNTSINKGLGQEAAGAGLAPLVDTFGRRHNYLRISLTERCNLRCQYCMPAAGVPLSARGALLTRGELLALARVFAAAGVDKVRLTGGEPTLRADLAEIIEGLRAIEGIRAVSMTSNGLVLTRRLAALQRAGLSALNVSLDSLRPDRYERMARRPGLARVLAGVDLALQLGYSPVKINTVLMKGFNDDEISDFVEYTRDRDVEVRFIEFMPFSGNEWDDSKMVPHRAALRALLAAQPTAQPEPPRPNDTAVVWRVPGYAGSVGFISSMTRNFCATCNRLRLTADGNLKVCLFGAGEVSLRDALRAGAPPAALLALVRRALLNKKHKHAESRPYGEPSDDTHRRLAARALRRLTGCGTFTARVGAGAGARAGAGAWRGRVRALARGYCTRAGAGGGGGGGGEQAEEEEDGGAFSHLDAEGRARMVDVGSKPVTTRVAEAECSLVVGARLLRLLRDARLPKGDALTVAQVAGAMGAKRTAELIPLCHPLPLDCVRVAVRLPEGECAAGGAIRVRCVARATARTGVEMEALTGAAVAALALYDMCKSVDRDMRVTELRVVRKTGGSADSAREPAPPPPLRAQDASPLRPDETFAPTNFMHF